jgi:colanic acid biosynthesis glycosyl transferase WcaI
MQVLWRPDLIISIAPALVCAPTALLVARLLGAQAWLHVQDFEVDLAFRMKLLKGSMLQRIISRVETWLMRRFDLVSTISQRMVERLIQKGVARNRIRYFPNWVDTGQIKPSPTSGDFRAELGIAPHALVVLFSGTLSDKQGPMVIPAAASLLIERPDIVFVICGDGVMKAQVWDASSGLPNVRLIPLQPVERLSELLSMADIHLLPQCLGAADLVLPSKLSGMLASGRPIIATCLKESELGEVVSKCGLVVPPEDPETLVDSICRLADDHALRMDLGRRARGYAEANFDLEAVLGSMFSPIESHAPLAGDIAA